jgi:hypothetical protein
MRVHPLRAGRGARLRVCGVQPGAGRLEHRQRNAKAEAVSRSDNSSKGCKAYPRRGRGFARNYLRPRVRAARRAAKLALRDGEEAAARLHHHHRHSVLWDRF